MGVSHTAVYKHVSSKAELRDLVSFYQSVVR